MNDRVSSELQPLEKASTGIEGLDHVLEGGLPEGRMIMVYGGPGTGKTVLCLQFLLHRASLGEAGLLVSFEERAGAIRRNARTMGWDLTTLEAQQKLFLLDAHVDPEMIISGRFSLKALLAILEGKAREIGARRIVIDAIDVLLRLLDDPSRERKELYLLRDWLEQNGMTGIITAKAESGDRRYAFLDYLTDTVIHLDQRVEAEVSTRRLRVLKYRGSGFSRNEHPYIIGPGGVEMLPLSAAQLHYQALGEPVSSGHPELDVMLGGGYRRGSVVLISGFSGTGKTTLAGTFARSAAERGERVLYVNFEESQAMMLGTLLSPGIDLRPHTDSGRIQIVAAGAQALGIEEHLINAYRRMEQFRPDHVILDAASSTERLGGPNAAYGYLVRLINLCRNAGRTLLMTNLLGVKEPGTISGLGISSLVDAVIFLQLQESSGELNRTLLVLKSRGAAHSNQTREFRITHQGIAILPPYAGEEESRTGVARQQQEAREAREERRLEQRIRTKQAEVERIKAVLNSRVSELQSEVEQAIAELDALRLELEEGRRERTRRLGMRRPNGEARGEAE